MSEDFAQAEMPRFKCHKEVHALQIADFVESHRDPELPIEAVPMDDRFLPIPLSLKWCQEHDVTPGGYYVVYDDGYVSFSPQTAFENGYTEL